MSLEALFDDLISNGERETAKELLAALRQSAWDWPGGTSVSPSRSRGRGLPRSPLIKKQPAPAAKQQAKPPPLPKKQTGPTKLDKSVLDQLAEKYKLEEEGDKKDRLRPDVPHRGPAAGRPAKEPKKDNVAPMGPPKGDSKEDLIKWMKQVGPQKFATLTKYQIELKNALAKTYVKDLRGKVADVVRGISSDFSDQPELGTMLAHGLIATLKGGLSALNKGQVPDYKDWEVPAAKGVSKPKAANMEKAMITTAQKKEAASLARALIKAGKRDEAKQLVASVQALIGKEADVGSGATAKMLGHKLSLMQKALQAGDLDALMQATKSFEENLTKLNKPAA